MAVLDEIAAERRRQVVAEGWTPEHDDEHSGGQMAYAAAWYAMNAESHDYDDMAGIPNGTSLDQAFEGSCSWCRWPWDRSWWKPKDRRRDLIRAGALIVAEIERLDRAALATPPAPETLDRGTLEAAARLADYDAETARLAMAGACDGETYLRAKETTASALAFKIRALSPAAANKPQSEWRPIESAPKDGQIIWAYLYQTGIRQVLWRSAEDIAADEGGPPELYEPGFYETDDLTEGWSPTWWLPYDALPQPPEGSR